MTERAVMVTWLDSCSNSGGPWMDREVVEKMTLIECVTVGFVMSETDDHVTVASSVTIEQQVAGEMCIPRSCITGIKEVWRDD